MATRADVPIEYLDYFDGASAGAKTEILNLLEERKVSPQKLVGIVPTLRAWTSDAETAVAGWDASTTAQKLATMKVVIARFGTMVDRMADLLTVLDKG